ncbi:MAG: peptidylprolyl isomerase [Burkholderiales bacterium]
MKARVLLFVLLVWGSPVFGENPRVEIKTNFGSMTLELYPDKAPLTVANYMQYVNNGFYDGTLFHRVVRNFVIQGGGYTPDLQSKPTQAPVANEATNGLRNEPGTVAMARTYNPHSATAQFFINLDDNKFLNHHKAVPDYYGYCVFGRIVEGMDVARSIGALPTTAAGQFDSDVPVQPVIIESVRVVPPPKRVLHNKKG